MVCVGPARLMAGVKRKRERERERERERVLRRVQDHTARRVAQNTNDVEVK